MKSIIVDLDRCNGCFNCQIACKDEHCDNDWRPIAAPQPNVLNFTSVMTLLSIFKNIFMMSPHLGLPTSPTPSAFSISPTLRGFAKWSITFALYIILCPSFRKFTS